MNNYAELVRDLYGKYAPDVDINEKFKYIVDNDLNVDDFVKEFYGKYAPEENLQEKQDYIFKNKLFLASPCCSYLIKVSSIPKIINKKLWSYYDAQHFNYNFFNNDTNIYLYKKQIFNTNYNISHNLKFNFIYYFFDKIFIYFNIPNIFFWTLFKIFRIPILNYELNSIEFNIICIIIIIFLYKWKKSSFKSIV